MCVHVSVYVCTCECVHACMCVHVHGFVTESMDPSDQ